LWLGLVAGCAAHAAEPVPAEPAIPLPDERTALVKEAAGGAKVLESEPGPLDKLTFMVGSWEGVDAGGNRVDEHWTQARGRMMLGVSRLTMGTTVAMFEHMHVEVRDDGGIVLVVQRRGGSPMDFKWTSGGRGFAVFSLDAASVKGQVWPSRILYGRAGSKLHVRFVGDSEVNGDDMAEEIVLHPAVVARWR
jgi:hypothetical protein